MICNFINGIWINAARTVGDSAELVNVGSGLTIRAGPACNYAEHPELIPLEHPSTISHSQVHAGYLLINGGKLPDRAETADAYPRANTYKMKSIGSRHRGCQNDVVPNQRIGCHVRSKQRLLVLSRVFAKPAAGLRVQSIRVGSRNGSAERGLILSWL